MRSKVVDPIAFVKRMLHLENLTSLNKPLVERRRKKANREASPRVGAIDSQSVKCSEWGVLPKGYDGHKKINGRKHHIVPGRPSGRYVRVGLNGGGPCGQPA